MERQRRGAGIQARHGTVMGIDDSIQLFVESVLQEASDATPIAGMASPREQPIALVEHRPDILVSLDPGWRHPRGPQQVECQTHIALSGVVIESERAAMSGQAIELAPFLGLPDEPLGQRLPGARDRRDTLAVAPDGGAWWLLSEAAHRVTGSVTDTW